MIEIKNASIIIRKNWQPISFDQVKIKAVRCRTALNPSRIPGMDYCLNPYVGCEHGCIYCYATFMKRFRNHFEEWGNFVDVKINFADILQKEVKKKKVGLVAIGTVQDAYQPIEAKYQITRQAIKMLGENNFPFEILTKSSLVARDLALLKSYKQSSVEMTITTINDSVRQIFEPKATPVTARLQALESLMAAGIETTVFFGPVLPYFSDSPEQIIEFFVLMQKLGVKRILVDKLNYLKSKISRIIRAVSQVYPKAIPYYRNVLHNPLSYAIVLRQRVKELARGFKFSVEVLF